MIEKNSVRLECGCTMTYQPWFAKRMRKGMLETCRYDGSVRVAKKITIEEVLQKPTDFDMHREWRNGK